MPCTAPRLLAGLLLGATLLTPLSTATPAIAADGGEAVTERRISDDQVFVAGQVNRQREQKDRSRLPLRSRMTTTAQGWAQHLASCQCLAHRQPPFNVGPGWYSAAENVGRSGDGGTLQALHTSFMRSTGHRQNIMNPRWTHLGIGVAQDRAGEWFVVQVFADFTR